MRVCAERDMVCRCVVSLCAAAYLILDLQMITSDRVLHLILGCLEVAAVAHARVLEDCGRHALLRSQGDTRGARCEARCV